MPGDTDFNLSDEVTGGEGEDGGENEGALHAGDHDGDEAGGEAEDRGDEVTGITDGGEGEGEGEGSEAAGALDPEFLESVAGAKEPKLVPYARLAEVVAQNAKLMDVLGKVAGGAPAAAAPAPAEPAAPAFDMKTKIKERNAALLEGDEEAAADIDMAIEEYRNNTLRAQVRQEAMQDFTASQQKTAADTIVADAFAKFTFLNDQSDEFNEEALEEVMMYRDRYIGKGDALPVALEKAFAKVCPQYVGDAGGSETPAGETPAQGNPAATRILRNAKAAASQPPLLKQAGTPNRETIDTTKLDLEGMDDDAYDKLPEHIKAKARGDVVA